MNETDFLGFTDNRGRICLRHITSHQALGW
jgi:hypothetical protein